MVSYKNKVACGIVLSLLAGAFSPAYAGYVCEGAKPGDIVEVFGVSVPQENGAGLLEKGDGFLIQIQGTSEGKKVDSYLYITEGLRQKLQRCSHSSQEVAYRVRCLKSGEPEVIQAVC